MNKSIVDVTNCDREPIHIPGSIQSHGFLVAVNKNDALVYYLSENTQDFTGLEAAQVLGRSFEWFLQQAGITLQSLSLSQLLSYNDDTDFAAVNPILVKIQDEPYYMIVHNSGDNFLLAEFELRYPSIEIDLQRVVGVSVSRILEGRTVNDILQNTARQVREIIQYDRVMIYKFHDDDHGEVIAEDKSTNVESFMGLHYPASDIPKQARELYLTNLTRIIVDVHSETSALLAYQSKNKKPVPLDLTHSSLRAVSPIHIQYLKNMGVAASFSVSLVSHNKLWGLIACHNVTPKFIEYKAREGAKLLGQILSSSLEYRDDEETKDIARSYHQAIDTLSKEMQKEENISDVFIKNKNLILQVTKARGVAIVFENYIYTEGITPSNEDIKEIVNWLKQNVSSQIFQTESFSEHYKPALQFTDIASGLLSCMLSNELSEYILWFKPELIKTINWAGNPEKPVETDENGLKKISPRHSFAVWSEQVKKTSENWTKAEVSSVMKLREDITYAIIQKANQIRLLNEKLKEAYEELDAFSFTISHDLKTPITSIRNYTEIILEENEKLNEDITKMLNRILKSTERMNLLIKEVLSYSRVSRKELMYEEIDMHNLIQETETELKNVYKKSNVKFIIKNLYNLDADKTMITQVFANIIGNAVKYSQNVAQPLVTIESLINGNDILYKVSDNGIGMDMSFGNQIFDIFKRLDNVKEYEGTGVGLSIVKRIMEKHAAKIWYESDLGKGTTFYLLFINNRSI